MALPPVSNPRISLNLKASNLLSTIRANQYAMFRSQNQLATGLRFQAPSEDPTRAAAALKRCRKRST
ncbi:MAG: hypothetical protein HZB38_13780 [Planctomycetes bacterium]|nr:hypothetical protein [Planctomycetota bacterium]